MAAKAPARADEKAKPEKTLWPPVASGVDEHGLRWEDVEVFGTAYRVREITVEEDDAAYDASILPDDEDKINPRIQTRMQLSTAIVSPPCTIDDIAHWPRMRLRALTFVFNRLNTLPPADAEGNA